MAILEKFKYYKRLLFQYISTRFGILKFTGFAILLAILGLTEMPEWKSFAESCIFIFASLFAFRLLDDVWSFHLDRIHHPQRTYLLPCNFNSFIFFTVLVCIVYLISLLLVSSTLAVSILILFLISTGLYIMFYKRKSIMTIIPLLKYPVLIWGISRFSLTSDVFLLSAGAFFMMLTSDFIAENWSKSNVHNFNLLLILITGILIFQPWIKGFSLIIDLILIAIPTFLIAFTSMKNKPIFPVVIFPVLHFFDLINSL